MYMSTQQHTHHEPPAEAVVGWRAWNVEDGQLVSPVYSMLWLPNQHATARTYDGTPTAPAEHNCYGLHAFTQRDALQARFADAPVIGRVRLWGTVTQHQHGWRGQRGYPYELVVNPAACENADEVARLLEAYGVPVAVLELT